MKGKETGNVSAHAPGIPGGVRALIFSPAGISVERVQNLSHPGKLLSLSVGRDEEAVSPWRSPETVTGEEAKKRLPASPPWRAGNFWYRQVSHCHQRKGLCDNTKPESV